MPCTRPKAVANECEARLRANVSCPGFARTPFVEKQIPAHAKPLGIAEADVIRRVMLKETVDGEYTTAADVAEATRLFRWLSGCSAAA